MDYGSLTNAMREQRNRQIAIADCFKGPSMNEVRKFFGILDLLVHILYVDHASPPPLPMRPRP